MGRMNLLDKVYNAAANQVEGFCIVKSVAIKSNIKGAAYLDMILADAAANVTPSFGITRRRCMARLTQAP